MLLPRLRRRRLGQGMTEYVIIVGLVAILLIATVRSFSSQIDLTIRGTTGKVDDMSNDIGSGGNNPGGNNPGGNQPGGISPSGEYVQNPDGSRGPELEKDASGNYYLPGSYDSPYTGPRAN